MTFHELLQMYLKFDQIHFGKDKGNSNFTFIHFEFLNLNPKEIL
jgi:hypothetical protein